MPGLLPPWAVRPGLHPKDDGSNPPFQLCAPGGMSKLLRAKGSRAPRAGDAQKRGRGALGAGAGVCGKAARGVHPPVVRPGRLCGGCGPASAGSAAAACCCGSRALASGAASVMLRPREASGGSTRSWALLVL